MKWGQVRSSASMVPGLKRPKLGRSVIHGCCDIEDPGPQTRGSSGLKISVLAKMNKAKGNVCKYVFCSQALKQDTLFPSVPQNFISGKKDKAKDVKGGGGPSS